MSALTIEQLRSRISDYVARRTYLKDTASKQLTAMQLLTEIQKLEKQLDGVEGQLVVAFDGRVKDVFWTGGIERWTVALDIGISNTMVLFYSKATKEYVQTLNKGDLIDVRGRITGFRPEREEGALSLSAEGTFHVYIDAEPPVGERERQSSCFIATAAFGAHATEVEELRRFRDSVLLRTATGRTFVRFYYIVSPPVAAVVKRNRWAQRLVRSALRRIVPLAAGQSTELRRSSRRDR